MRVQTEEHVQEKAQKGNEAFKVEMFNLDFPGSCTSIKQVKVTTEKAVIPQYALDSDAYPDSEVQGDEILAKQQLFTRNQALNGATKIVWCIHNLNDNLRTPDKEDGQTRYLRSNIVQTQDGSLWLLEL